MELFHYHYWTNAVEETEMFYVQNDFQVTGRFAVAKGGIQPYHPPLTWDDFRDESPQFRIVEVRKGRVNITFGAGKKPMFDHIGFLVTKEEYTDICSRASRLGWKLDEDDRRTFIGTPFRLRIELQQREDVIGKGEDKLSSMHILVKDNQKMELGFMNVFGRKLPELLFSEGDQLALERVRILGQERGVVADPNGVAIEFVNNDTGPVVESLKG